jgi:DNA-binding NarL/FixJ family response regulator
MTKKYQTAHHAPGAAPPPPRPASSVAVASPAAPRGGSHAVHRRATTGREALTATEHEVAAHLAQGHSNAEIAARPLVSRGTIATHVNHILTKLQVRSRVDIARAVTRHEAAIAPAMRGPPTAP